MSQMHYANIHSSIHPLGLVHSHPWQVCEDGDDYDARKSPDSGESLFEMTDYIIDRLTRAEALAWVLQGAEHHPEKAANVTAMVIAELVREALEAYEKQWEKVQHQNESVR